MKCSLATYVLCALVVLHRFWRDEGWQSARETLAKGSIVILLNAFFARSLLLVALKGHAKGATGLTLLYTKP